LVELSQLGEIVPSDTKIDFLQKLRQYLSSHRHEFTGPNAHDSAVGVANQQPDRWNKLLSVLQQPSPSQQPSAAQHLQVFNQIIAGSPNNPNITRDGKIAVLETQRPLLLTEPSQELLNFGRRYPVVAALVIATRCQDTLFGANNQHAILWLLAANTIETAVALDPNFQQLAVQLRQAVGETGLKWMEQVDDLRKFKIRLSEDMKLQTEVITATEQRINQHLDKIGKDEISFRERWDNELSGLSR
jgi:hypothetical protein